jgi:hypothetical protein
VISVLSKGYDADRQELELRRLAARPRQQPTPAEATTLQAPPPAGKMTADTAEQKYGEIGRLLKEPTKNAGKIEALKKELSDAGYDL